MSKPEVQSKICNLRWSLSPDACSEVRRRAYASERNLIEATETETSDNAHAVVVDFLHEEFSEFVASSRGDWVAPDSLSSAESWGFPGEWVTPLFNELLGDFGVKSIAYLYSKSGDFTIALTRLDQ